MFRILIADRQENLLWVLQRFLLADDRDIYIKTSMSGEGAVRALHDEPFDLLITDLRLRGETDGFDLLSLGRQLYPQLRVILHSTLSADITERLVRRVGADLYIQKPFSLSHLQDAVQYVRTKSVPAARKQISKAGVADLVEMLCSKRRTALVRLRNSGKNGLIAIDAGRLIHALYEDLKGTDALNAMVALDGGEIHLTTEVSVDEQTITVPWDVAVRKARQLRSQEASDSRARLTTPPQALSFEQFNDSMVSSVVSRTQRVYRDFPVLRENADEFVRRCPGVLAYGLFRLNEVFSLSFQMSSGKRNFSDSQLISYLDQIAHVTRSTAQLFDHDMIQQFAIELDDVMVVTERIHESKYAQVVVFKVGGVELDFVTLLMTQMGANYSLALGGVER